MIAIIERGFFDWIIYQQWPFRHALTRDQYVVSWLESLPASSILLDAGAGTKRYKHHAMHTKYISQDFGEYTGGNAYSASCSDEPLWNSLDYNIMCDICQIPMPSNSVDNILCSEVFEHLPDPGLALKELARLVKPGGSILITAPFRSIYHQVPYYFCSGFSTYWYEYWSAKYGLKMSSVIMNGSFLHGIIEDLLRFFRARRLIGKILLFPWFCSNLFALSLFKLLGFDFSRPLGPLGYFVLLTKPSAIALP